MNMPVSIPLGCLGLILWLVALIGNILVITAIVRSPYLRKPSNVYICSLALADVLVSTMCAFQMVLNVLEVHLETNVCAPLFVIAFTVSGLNIMSIELISLDRFFAIYWPLWYRQRCSNSRAVKLSVVAAVFTVALNVVIMTNVIPLQKKGTCFSGLLVTKVFAIFVFVQTGVVILELTMIYGAMFYKAISHQRSNRTGIFSTNSDLRIIDIKALKTCSIILGSFLATWLPQVTCISLMAFSADPEHYRQAVGISMMLPTLGSVLDPIVYAVMNPHIRNGIRRLAKTKPRTNEHIFVTQDQTTLSSL